MEIMHHPNLPKKFLSSKIYMTFLEKTQKLWFRFIDSKKSSAQAWGATPRLQPAS
jgi:hypothetical protein